MHNPGHTQNLDITLYLPLDWGKTEQIMHSYNDSELLALVMKELALAQDIAPHAIIIGRNNFGYMQNLGYNRAAQTLTATFVPKANLPLENKIYCIYWLYMAAHQEYELAGNPEHPPIERMVEALEHWLGGVDGIGPQGAPAGTPKLITTFVHFGNHWAAISIEKGANGKYYVCLFNPVGKTDYYRPYHDTLQNAFQLRYGDNLIWQDNDIVVQRGNVVDCGLWVTAFQKLAASTIINGGSIAANFPQFIRQLQNSVQLQAKRAEYNSTRQRTSLYSRIATYLAAQIDALYQNRQFAEEIAEYEFTDHIAPEEKSEHTPKNKIIPHAIIALTTVNGFFALQYLAQELIWGGYIAAAIVGAGISISYAKATDSGDTTSIIYGTGSGLLQYGAIHGAHYGCEALLQAYCSDPALLSQAPAICGITAVAAGLAMAAIYTIISINIENAKCC